MNIPGTTKGYTAEAAIGAHRIVKHGTADGQAVQGAADTDALMGISTELPSDEGETVDVVKTGLADVEYGGAVTRGDPLTSDSVGRAVKAAPAAGENANLVGYAEVSGVLGDIGSAAIFPSVMQG